MQIHVGTSGWYYEWNPDKTLDWYLEHSGLDAIELNASFYRFPFPNQISAWAKKGRNLKWVVKVNRLITHQHKFSDKTLGVWERFHGLFSPMHKLIDLFLLQLPPSVTPRARPRIADFVEKTGMPAKFAFEPRNEQWFTDEHVAWAKELGLTWVSIDAPQLSREIHKTTGTVYVRLHGRTVWYAHNYTSRELWDVGSRILDAHPRKVYVFFNNDHSMLKNAQLMRKILTAL